MNQNLQKETQILLSNLDRRLQSIELALRNTSAINYKKYLSSTEASEYLKISPSTLFKYTSAKKIQFSKTGKRIYFLTEDLNNFLSSNIIKSRVRENYFDVDSIVNSITKRLR